MLDISSSTIFWLALGVVLAVAEGLTVQLVSIWFALGAVVSALASAMGAGLKIQLVVFVVISSVLLICTRPILKNKLKVKKISTNADSLIGQSAIVTEAIDNKLSHGRVAVSGLEWSARSDDEVCIAAESKVRIMRIEGVKLIVQVWQ